MKNDGCQDSIPTFFGRLGLYIEGSVSPPLSGVHIRIIAAGDSSIASLKNGELVLETATDIDGSFVGGPLYDDITYSVEARKVRNVYFKSFCIISVVVQELHFLFCLHWLTS